MLRCLRVNVKSAIIEADGIPRPRLDDPERSGGAAHSCEDFRKKVVN